MVNPQIGCLQGCQWAEFKLGVREYQSTVQDLRMTIAGHLPHDIQTRSGGGDRFAGCEDLEPEMIGCKRQRCGYRRALDGCDASSISG